MNLEVGQVVLCWGYMFFKSRRNSGDAQERIVKKKILPNSQTCVIK
jgi:hypothetical protein